MARIIPIPIGSVYPGGPCGGIIHVIQQGDTLYELGKFYHVSVGQLIFANPFVDVYNLQIGEELCIPVSPRPMPLGAGERRHYQTFSDWEASMGNNREGWQEDMEAGREGWEEDMEAGREGWDEDMEK